ncbi:ACP S-malonyltransferase [bacterium]|nr:ACP S-malonyltransferase [bacterium]
MDKKKDKIVLMYPGQGSQYTGMGLEYLDCLDDFRNYFSSASDVIEEDLLEIIFNKNNSGFKLENTLYSQISIYTMSAVINDYLFKNCFLKKNCVFALTGHSLGDYSALYASGCFNFADGLKLVKYRGQLMAEANEKMDGMMAAVLGTDLSTLESSLIDFKKRYIEEVYIANYNDYSQIVISGTRSNVENAIEFLKEKGIRKIIPLKVKIASHTPLMREVAINLGNYIRDMKIDNPSINFYSPTSLNYPGREELSFVLENQLTSKINWVKTIEYLLNNEAVDIFIEIGPGKVLSGLVKRISEKNNKDVLIFNTDKMSDINNFKDFLN